VVFALIVAVKMNTEIKFGTERKYMETKIHINFNWILFWQAIFLLLKIENIINWSWVWVFIPLWLPVAIFALIFLVGFIIGAIKG